MKRPALGLLPAVALLTLTACGDKVPENAKPLAMTRVGPSGSSTSFTYTGYQESTRTVINDSSSWQAAWGTLWASSPTQGGLAPYVDFSVETVILVAMGEKPRGGYQIQITAVDSTPDKVYVSVTEASPGSGCIVNDIAV
ncbi:MAG TPA: protease complex subunit PrcB family protein, partial [Gemmatimonadales bacterium]|nr:protease complex subunit PrcB family protein [Gemmatimonadales bacterium]